MNKKKKQNWEKGFDEIFHETGADYYKLKSFVIRLLKALDQQEQKYKQELREKIEGMKKDSPTIEQIEAGAIESIEYNQALEDINQLLK